MFGGAGVSPMSARGFAIDRTRLRATGVVAAVLAAVVLGGAALDAVIPAPTAGTQAIGGGVTITAASGWVLAGGTSADRSGGIVLEKGDATLFAEVVNPQFDGSSSDIAGEVELGLRTEVAQISFGDPHQTRVSGNDTTTVLFEAIVDGAAGPAGAAGAAGNQGTVDGELVCMVVAGRAVLVEVAAPQGDLAFATADVTAMVRTVKAAR